MSAKISVPERHKLRRVVIVGGGFGGLRLARKIDRNYFQVVLIDKNNYHQFQPLFYQVATSGIEPSDISFPFRKIFQHEKNIYFRLCEALRVDRELSVLHTSIGEISYDYLIIAGGCKTNFYGNSKMEERCLTLKSVPEALYLRNHILESIEKALNATEEHVRDSYLNFIIVGGGATGVELGGALAEMKKYVLPKDYPELDFSKMKIWLLDASSRVLSAFDEKASDDAARYLKKMGVRLLMNTTLKEYEDHKATLSNDEVIYSRSLFWVAGICGNKLEGFKDEQWGRGDRLITDTNLLVSGEKNIYAIGDIGLQPSVNEGRGYPQVAQVAIQQGEYVAQSLYIHKLFIVPPPFIYRDKGSMATVGRNVAIARIGKLKLHGVLAWFVWCFVHLMTIVGVKNKLFIFINWLWSYITYDLSLRLIIKPFMRKKE
ncbi:MAG: NAD(P)/FAD-dependent oxidoreductase [Bacteroidales bacterium]